MNVVVLYFYYFIYTARSYRNNWKMSTSNVFEFDLKRNELISDFSFDVSTVDFNNLQDNGLKFYARNNKYPEGEINPDKIGKWMIFVEDSTIVNELWGKITKGVREGHLWRVRLSLRDLTKPIRNDNCVAILFYTKDYTDKKDVTLVKMGLTNPTDITKDVAEWLYEFNGKYPLDEVDDDKIGKWMLFPKPPQVNSIWSKIRQAVKEEHLWQAKVSTREVSKPTLSYAIMIYTKDYTDLDDVIETLDYLESSGIKPPHWVIRYKTDQQTRAGIYSGGGQKPWIYSSDTIRLRNQNVK